MGADRIISIEQEPERIALARQAGATDIIDFREENVLERLKELTGGKGPNKCIDAVGLEAHGENPILQVVEKALTAVKLETDRSTVLREAIMACQPAGILSIPGVYGGSPALMPFGAAFQKGLTFRMGQTHVNRWTDDLLRRIQEGEIDTTFLITHVEPLERGPEMYKTFRDKKDGCVKVLLKP
jgi:threonine dehydrogenase-like Zn-dependent dehydrogenase